MRVIPPVLITDNVISAPSVAEPDATYDSSATLWSSGAGYSVGAVVYRTTTHKLYQCAVAITAASAKSQVIPEVEVFSTPPSWTELRSTNRWAMFDLYRNTQTTATNTISVAITPGIRFDAVALTGLENVTSANINISSPGASTITLVNGTVSTSTLIYFDIPPFYNGTLNITLNGTGIIKCGRVVLGNYVNLGSVQRGANADAINFSSVNRDLYGNTELVQRRSVPKISVKTVVLPQQLDRLSILRNSLNAKPALWSGLDDKTTDNFYDSLLIIGFYKTFRFNIDNPIAATIDLDLEEI